ncbi:chitinase [Sphaerisporangium melleum]|uniref:Chitinase n=1 Tax=Sphaerisporangium melleum TaxID=321316 RepID=A0A917VUH7_9ACTN|nr:cellulose binding domain-containing protein [Sphaerisporangium melleum]GGL15256.1 chitinase [Sphaerisporangium melleum]GII74535.1 chitinase [Sphaerisporangium melleum]
MRLIRLCAAALTAAAAVLVAGGTPASAAAVTATFTKPQDWGTGFEGKYTITNGTSSTLNGWTVAFDLPSGYSVTTAWDAVMTKSGQHYTFANPSWAPTLAAGASITFGFNGAPGNFTAPQNCTINGASCSGGTTNPGAPGTPGTPSVTGTTGSSISLSWTASSGTVTGYRVYEGSAVRATVTGTSATVGSLATCSTHTYTVKAYNSVGESAASGAATGTTTGCPQPTGGSGAPYLYMGWGSPPSPASVMSATGVKWFTMAFVLSGGGCTPAWDGQRPLQGGVDATAIGQIKAAGGEIVPSFGGWSGNKLGPNCATPQALAGAYQQVISAYNLKAIDIDIENSDEFENEAVQDRILNALKIVKQNNPGIKTIVTFGTGTSGPNYYGTRLINQAAALGAGIDVFTIMPFDFGGGADMYQSTVNASEGLKNALKNAFGWSDATAYAHMGISGMNGLSDQQELTSPGTWTQIRDWAKSRGLARLAFWSVNRDRPCPGGGVTASCSGISQSDWEFTRITAGF